MRLRLGMLALASSVALASCTDSGPAPVETVANSRARASSVAGARGLGVPANARKEEALFARLSQTAPSAAGMYYDSLGTLVVRVRDASDDNAASNAVRSMLSAMLIVGSGRGRAAGDVRVERAQYTYRELSEWREQVFDLFFGRDLRVTSLDLDERQNRVVIGLAVDSFSATRNAVAEKLASVGVDTNAVRFTKAAAGRPDVLMAAPQQLVDQTSDPLAGGLILDIDNNGTWANCTLGLVADRNGQRGLITNSHCTSQMFNPDADQFYQRFPRLVATASVDPNAYTCGVQRCRGADAMFASAAAGASMAVGKVVKTQASNGGGYGGGWGTLYVDQAKPYFTVVATGDALVGTRINKVGITTGWTWGDVAGTCVDGYILMNGYINVIRCEDEADYVAYDGD